MIVISWCLIFLGTFFVITGVIGILRFTGLYNKFHPAGIIDALGMPLILIGLAIRSDVPVIILKILLIILMIWITSSTASYTIAQAYYRKDKQ